MSGHILPKAPMDMNTDPQLQQGTKPVPQSSTTSQAQRRGREAERTRAPLRRHPRRQHHSWRGETTWRHREAHPGRDRRQRFERRHRRPETHAPVDDIGAVALPLRTRNTRSIHGRARRARRAIHGPQHPPRQLEDPRQLAPSIPEERHLVPRDHLLHPPHDNLLAPFQTHPLRTPLVVRLVTPQVRVQVSL